MPTLFALGDSTSSSLRVRSVRAFVSREAAAWRSRLFGFASSRSFLISSFCLRSCQSCTLAQDGIDTDVMSYLSLECMQLVVQPAHVLLVSLQLSLVLVRLNDHRLLKLFERNLGF